MRYSTSFTNIVEPTTTVIVNAGSASALAGVPVSFSYERVYSSNTGYALDCWGLLDTDRNTRIMPKITAQTNYGFTAVFSRNVTAYYTATGR